jgi:hypothetical protein
MRFDWCALSFPVFLSSNALNLDWRVKLENKQCRILARTRRVRKRKPVRKCHLDKYTYSLQLIMRTAENVFLYQN